MQGLLTMSHQELDRFGVISRVQERRLTQAEGARTLGLGVRSLMVAGGLWLPRKLRPPRIQQPRARRACAGELIQIDGCEHAWFEDRAPTCTTLVYVDDATSRLMTVLFTGTESTFAYFEATRQYLTRYGKPLAFYSEKASVFRVNLKSATGGDEHTQFGRALEISIRDTSPGASGRQPSPRN
jgi:hypothetical protein